MIRYLIFFIVTAFFIYVSRNALLRPHTHGFYRFFAWEFILALILLNAPHWDSDPRSANQLVSWLLLTISIVLAVHGADLLQLAGKPGRSRPDAELLPFEKTSRLVTIGAYKYIRHPLYSSLLFLTWGAFLKYPSLPGVLLAGMASIFLLLTALRDESECIRHFGSEYQAYMLKTKRFVPFLF